MKGRARVSVHTDLHMYSSPLMLLTLVPSVCVYTLFLYLILSAPWSQASMSACVVSAHRTALLQLLLGANFHKLLVEGQGRQIQ